jgi:proline iminopeptidase
LYWETCGNPRGKPALVVHGGPGIGCTSKMRRAFDPQRYRIVLFDQRGTGRSLPHASEPSTDMRHNTTPHLLEDIEKLRDHLGVERWLLSAGSWGTTLALAYAERVPERVSELVLSSVFLGRRRDIDWLYRGVSRFFPEEWRRFRDHIPEAERGDLVAAYARLMEQPQARDEAAECWATWEDAVLSLEPQAKARFYRERPHADLIAFVRVCAHYFAHGAWLEDDQLLRDAPRLAGIRGVIIHGRLDLSCPVEGAWELARAWPDASFYEVSSGGHQANAELRRLLLRAHAELI